MKKPERLILYILLAFLLYVFVRVNYALQVAQHLDTQSAYNCTAGSPPKPLIIAVVGSQSMLMPILNPTQNVTGRLESQYNKYSYLCKPIPTWPLFPYP